MTSYVKVFTPFVHKMLDRSFIDAPEEVSTSDMIELLNTAAFLVEYPKIALTRDNLLMEFVNDLGEDEIQLLSHYMVYTWSSRNLRDVDNYTIDMTTSEFKTFSKGNGLAVSLDNHKLLMLEIKNMSKIYHMRHTSGTGFAKLGGR